MDEEMTSMNSDIPDRLKKQKRLFSFLTRKDVPPVPLHEERKELVNLYRFTSLLFFWVQPLLSVGYARTIQPNDIPYLNERAKVETMYKRFEYWFNYYNEHYKTKYLMQKCKERGETLDNSSVSEQEDLKDYMLPSSRTVLILVLTLGWQKLYSVIGSVVANVTIVVTPLLTRKMILYVTEKSLGLDVSVGKGVGYAIGISLLLIVEFFFLNGFFFYSTLSGAQAKAVLTRAILAKAFQADAKGRHDFQPSKLTTLVGTDLAKLDLALLLSPDIVGTPPAFIIAIIILAINLGAATGVAVAVLVFLSIFFITAAMLMANYRTKSLVFTEKRVNYVKEIVSSLKIIKFYSWEDSYSETVTNARIQESKKLIRLQSYRNTAFIIVLILTPLASLATFLVVYAIDNGKRTAANVFSSVSLLTILSMSFSQLPFAVGSTVDGIISLNRVFKFLICGEASIFDNVEINEDNLPLDTDSDQTVIDAKDASFQWEVFQDEEDEEEKKEKKEKEKKKQKQDKKNKTKVIAEVVEEVVEEKSEPNDNRFIKKFEGLNDINLKIQKGEFIMIVGTIGSGKTSLLNALSGFMTRTKGSVEINGSILLCTSPWAQNATVKENIIFGKEFDEKKYEQIIYSCALNDDLAILPAGDRTEVGERGITLSGGQKSRLNLARAIYANKDILLLDDVLSAVDARVGKHIMETAMLGLLKEKTRILATHQLSFLSFADRVIYLNGNGSIDVGTVDELNGRNEGFRNLLVHKDRDDNLDQKKEEKEDVSDKDKEEDLLVKNNKDNIEIKEIDANIRTDGRLIENELSAQNAITWKIYKSIFVLGSGRVHPIIFLLIALFSSVMTEFCALFATVWLSFWTENKFKNLSNATYMVIYGMIIIGQVISIFVQFSLYIRVIIVASRYLNISAIKRILHVPMSFMDTTPTGRILNRFTKDTDASDNELVENVRIGLYMAFEVIGTLILSIIYMPWIAIVFPVLILIAIFLTGYYQASSRELKRLESVQRSLYLNNFSEVLNGLETIKAYRADGRFLRKNDYLVNRTNEAAILVNGVQRWVGLQINWICIIYVLLLTLLLANGVFNVNPSSVGLVLAYILPIPDLLSFVIRFLTLAENDMTSYERVHEYAYDIPQEAAFHIADTKPPEKWPTNGEISFDNVSMRYREGLPKVLKNVSFDVQSNERIGVCGRTGAGKSTIMSTLFRISELAEGKISIDGIDISLLGLNELRSKLSIIPQESVLFSGNIRKNLDPFNQVEDTILWDSLRRAGLIENEVLEEVKKQSDSKNLHKFHLNATVENDGSNFSLGEKQLIAFARALVRNSKILVLDEATSSVDYATDAKIQKTIVNEFNNCTILCIAHRLRTIIKYDKILVLDKGEVKEFDTPLNLFNDENSIFHLLCQKSKITRDEF